MECKINTASPIIPIFILRVSDVLRMKQDYFSPISRFLPSCSFNEAGSVFDKDYLHPEALSNHLCRFSARMYDSCEVRLQEVGLQQGTEKK